jgi:hypothetical protein
MPTSCGMVQHGAVAAAEPFPCAEAVNEPEVVVLLASPASAPPGAPCGVAGSPGAGFSRDRAVTVAYKIPASQLDSFLASTGGRVVAASPPAAAWAGPAAAAPWAFAQAPAPASPQAGATRQWARAAGPRSQHLGVAPQLPPPYQAGYELSAADPQADCSMLDCPSLEASQLDQLPVQQPKLTCIGGGGGGSMFCCATSRQHLRPCPHHCASACLPPFCRTLPQ